MHVRFTKKFLSGALEGLQVRVGFGLPSSEGDRAKALVARWEEMARLGEVGRDVGTKSTWTVVAGSAEMAA
jgi:hypothetical protein